MFNSTGNATDLDNSIFAGLADDIPVARILDAEKRLL
jgi:hypothetical protein